MGQPETQDNTSEKDLEGGREISAKHGRRYELDWLRVLVILNLIPYHAAWLMVAVPGFSGIDKGSTGGTILTVYFKPPLIIVGLRKRNMKP